jgi:hypothetical protein
MFKVPSLTQQAPPSATNVVACHLPQTGFSTCLGRLSCHRVAQSFDSNLRDRQWHFSSLGLRGGEGGTTPALAAVVNAIVDAPSEFGVKHNARDFGPDLAHHTRAGHWSGGFFSLTSWISICEASSEKDDDSASRSSSRIERYGRVVRISGTKAD